MALIGLLAIVITASIICYVLLKRLSRFITKIDLIQGPRALPILGNAHQFHFQPDEFFEQAQGISYMYQANGERICRIWISGFPFVLLYGAAECEAVLSSSKMLQKPIQYSFLSPWIGEGLLVSKPEKWRGRRKLLTPTFHYDILKDFVGVYNRHGRTLIGKFEQIAATNEFTDIFHTITLCTLDVICEAALGICIDAQNKPSNYLEAVFKMKFIIHQRQIKAQYYPDLLFNLIGKGRDQAKYVKVLHDFSYKVIMERKRQADAAGGVAKLLEKEKEAGTRRMAFLDLMLDMHEKGEMPLNGIQEEVDTFTFEGHDTTSASINWFLHLIASNPPAQMAAQREADEVIGPDENRPICFDDLSRLVYLEACIKETLRLYPSVPLFARQVTEELNIKSKVLPAGTAIAIVPSMVHRDPAQWPDPEIFRPERFLEMDTNRHPYAYIPFSAGSRNCIGQRFAMMEEKCILAMVLRQFRIRSKLRTDQMRVAAELIIRPMYGNWIRFEKRNYGEY